MFLKNTHATGSEEKVELEVQVPSWISPRFLSLFPLGHLQLTFSLPLSFTWQGIATNGLPRSIQAMKQTNWLVQVLNPRAELGLAQLMSCAYI